LIDLFPAADPGAPCLVFIHGGYWQMNSKESFACIGDGLRAHGWSAAFPGYTLAPDTSLGGIVAEIDGALDFLVADGAGEGIAGPLVIAGWSAGGHLAALALRHHAVAAGLSISGIHELAPLRDTYLNERLMLTDAEINDLSPIRLPIVQKPFLIAYGLEELPALRLNAVAFHAARSEASAPGSLIAVPGCNHFTILDKLRDPDGILTYAMKNLLL
jgi:acetyl esterase/lipase